MKCTRRARTNSSREGRVTRLDARQLEPYLRAIPRPFGTLARFQPSAYHGNRFSQGRSKLRIAATGERTVQSFFRTPEEDSRCNDRGGGGRRTDRPLRREGR